MLHRVHPYGTFSDGGSAFYGLQVVNRRINRRLLLQVTPPKLDPVIYRSRLQAESYLFAGVQRRAA